LPLDEYLSEHARWVAHDDALTPPPELLRRGR